MAISEVISEGLCVGCGACAVAEPKHFKVVFDERLKYKAIRLSEVDPQADKVASAVCPFSGESPNETETGRRLFGQLPHDDFVGFYSSLYAGAVAEGQFRVQGSSGGMGSWILSTLLRNKHVDGVIHVRPSARKGQDGAPIFEFGISRSPEEIAEGAKSKYYPVELSHVLRAVQSMPGRYAVTGVPCFLKAVRALQQQSPVLQERLGPFVGLICGHLKGAGFGGLLAWQVGVDPQRTRELDFRVKLEGRPASSYAMRAVGDDVERQGVQADRTVPMNQLYGGDWGWGLFKYKACDYCDDVFAETADIVIGDAWLPQYEKDWLGTNVIVTRSDEMSQLVAEGARDGRLSLTPISLKEAHRSQTAGIRHRREELPYRLQMTRRAGHWAPPKRVPASSRLTWDRKAIQYLRVQIRDQSERAYLKALQVKDLSYFFRSMKPYTFLYRAVYRLARWF